MQIVSELEAQTTLPWYADSSEVVVLASVLVDADWLSTPRDVIEFFEKPWKWDDLHQLWTRAGRPRAPSGDDLAHSRQVGQGAWRRELERRHRDGSARWQALLDTLEAHAAGAKITPREERSVRRT
ncbi:MAG: hypothetical protein PHQ28_00980 [Mycobacterium sp.]|nr:hypothetical protein [Mycobacterium sp.]